MFMASENSPFSYFHRHIKIGGTDLKDNSLLNLLVVLAVRFVFIYCFEVLRKLSESIYIKHCSIPAFFQCVHCYGIIRSL